ncbi:MAG: preprotein translocase subunit SecG [Bacteroidia bacterium]
MFILLGSLCLLIAVALILAVVVQNSKGGGLSSTFGAGAQQILGARRSNEFIEKLTWYLAGGLAIIAFAANIFSSSGTQIDDSLRMGSKIEDQIIQQPLSVPDASQFEAPPAGEDGQ